MKFRNVLPLSSKTILNLKMEHRSTNFQYQTFSADSLPNCAQRICFTSSAHWSTGGCRLQTSPGRDCKKMVKAWRSRWDVSARGGVAHRMPASYTSSSGSAQSTRLRSRKLPCASARSQNHRLALRKCTGGAFIAISIDIAAFFPVRSASWRAGKICMRTGKSSCREAVRYMVYWKFHKKRKMRWGNLHNGNNDQKCNISVEESR